MKLMQHLVHRRGDALGRGSSETSETPLRKIEEAQHGMTLKPASRSVSLSAWLSTDSQSSSRTRFRGNGRI